MYRNCINSPTKPTCRLWHKPIVMVHPAGTVRPPQYTYAPADITKHGIYAQAARLTSTVKEGPAPRRRQLKCTPQQAMRLMEALSLGPAMEALSPVARAPSSVSTSGGSSDGASDCPTQKASVAPTSRVRIPEGKPTILGFHATDRYSVQGQPASSPARSSALGAEVPGHPSPDVETELAPITSTTLPARVVSPPSPHYVQVDVVKHGAPWKGLYARRLVVGHGVVATCVCCHASFTATSTCICVCMCVRQHVCTLARVTHGCPPARTPRHGDVQADLPIHPRSVDPMTNATTNQWAVADIFDACACSKSDTLRLQVQWQVQWWAGIRRARVPSCARAAMYVRVRAPSIVLPFTGRWSSGQAHPSTCGAS